MRWTKFDGESIGARRRQIRVSLGTKKDFHLNGRAYEELGEPAAVELFFDEMYNRIGMRKCDRGLPNAFHLIKRHRSNFHQINAATFCNRFGLKINSRLTFENAYLDPDGILVLDLKKAIPARRAE